MQVLYYVTVILLRENGTAGGCETVAETKHKSFQWYSGQHAKFDILHDMVGHTTDAARQSTIHWGPRSAKYIDHYFTVTCLYYERVIVFTVFKINAIIFEWHPKMLKM